MSLGLLKNYTADVVVKQMEKVIADLGKSNERLSTGKVINGSEDNPASMIIGSLLGIQADSLSTGNKNANDAISILQIADSLISEMISLTEKIKSKAVQASQGILSLSDKQIIQNDISSLVQDMENIARTASFNGTKLLMGNYVNKKFQVGAYSYNTIDVSISSVLPNDLDATAYTDINFNNVDDASSVDLFLGNQKISADLKYDNLQDDSAVGLEKIIDKINEQKDALGITAFLKGNVKIDNIDIGNELLVSDATHYIKINGVEIKNIDTRDNGEERLVESINFLSYKHKVKARLNDNNKLVLESTNGNGISVETFGNGIIATNTKTFGTIQLIKKNSTTIDFDAYDATKIDESSSQNITTANTGYGKLDTINVLDYDSAQIAMSIAENAISSLIKIRTEVGISQKSFEITISKNYTMRNNLRAAESTIMDVDFAEETINYNKLNVLAQTCSYTLKQANAISEMVLILLKD